MVSVWRSQENLLEDMYSFNLVGFEAPTQVVRLRGKDPYLQSNLTSPPPQVSLSLESLLALSKVGEIGPWAFLAGI